MKKILAFILTATLLVQCTPTKDIAKTDMSTKVMKKKDFRSSPPAPGPATKLSFGETQRFTLDNGLKVIVVENHKLPRVSFQLSVDTHPFTEGDIAGAADLTGQLLSAGTSTRTKADIDAAVDFIGASLNTSARGAFASSLSKHKETLLGLMSDVLFNPSFPSDQLDKFKKQTISGLQFRKDDPNTIANNVGNVLNYGKGTALGELTTESSIERVTIEDCKQYYNKYFKPNIAYLVIVGDITSADAKMVANKYFGQWKRGNVQRENFMTPTPPTERTIDFVHKEGAVQSVINMTYPVKFNRKSDDYVAASLMNTLFGGFFGSRLNQNLREKNAFTYGARSSLSQSRFFGEFSTSMSVRNEVTDSSMTNILMELDQIINTPITAEDLTFVRSYRGGNFAMSLERPQTLANFALNIEREGLPADFYETYLQRLDKVTVADMQAAAKKYLKPDAAHFLIVGSKEDVADLLKPFAPDGKINFYDNYGQPVEEIEGGVPEGLTAADVIDDYITAIGGKSKIMAVKDISLTMEADTPMGALSVKQMYMSPDKVKSEIAIGGNVMGGATVNGDKGFQSQAGQKIPMEAAMIATMKEGGNPFSQIDYVKMGYDLKLKGLEAIGDAKCYKIIFEKSDGSKVTEYYDIQTSLLIKSITVNAIAPEGTPPAVSEFGDYKSVEGIMIPHTVKTTGLFPIPLSLSLSETKINSGMSAADFAVE